MSSAQPDAFIPSALKGTFDTSRRARKAAKVTAQTCIDDKRTLIRYRRTVNISYSRREDGHSNQSCSNMRNNCSSLYRYDMDERSDGAAPFPIIVLVEIGALVYEDFECTFRDLPATPRTPLT